MKQKYYNLRSKHIISMALYFGIISFAGKAMAQGKKNLQIGDKVPEIHYGKWLKGNPLKLDDPSRLYIVEFWATWCGPCIASMPHLSEFAKKHASSATVIGVDIWEGAHGDSGKPYESFLPKVNRFVRGMGDKMAYNVIMDNNDQFMANNWMKAAGQEGIPCSFMIKNGTILWIGHPINLDSIYTVVNSGSYDITEARKAAIAAEEKRAALGNPFQEVYKDYESAMKEKEFTRAIQILDSGIKKMPPMANALRFFKFQTLLENFSEDSAMTFLKDWRKMKDPQFTGSVSAVIATKSGLSTNSYMYAIGLLKTLINNPQPPAIIYNLIAKACENMGDYTAAIKSEEQAIKEAKQSLKEGKYTGFILEDTVKGYEKTLAEYKKHLK